MRSNTLQKITFQIIEKLPKSIQQHPLLILFWNQDVLRDLEKTFCVDAPQKQILNIFHHFGIHGSQTMPDYILIFEKESDLEDCRTQMLSTLPWAFCAGEQVADSQEIPPGDPVAQCYTAIKDDQDAIQMPSYDNLLSILNDSYSPAIVLPTQRTKIYHSSLRKSLQHLSSQAPFCSLLPGDALSFLIPNSLEFVGVFLTCVGLRGIANPLNPAYTKTEVKFYLEDVKPKALVVLKEAPNFSQIAEAASELNVPLYTLSVQNAATTSKNAKPVRKSRFRAALGIKVNKAPLLIAIDPVFTCSLASPNGLNTQLGQRKTSLSTIGHCDARDIALFLHTSGTTGRPKMVPLTHRNILTSLSNIQATYHLGASDVSYLVMPLFHVHGLIGCLLSTFYSGGTVVIPPKFSATQFWHEFIAFKATWYTAVPTIHQILLSTSSEHFKGTTGRLRFIRSCSASLQVFHENLMSFRAPATLEQLEKTFKAPVIEAYAMTEAAHQMTANFLPNGIRKPGSVGKGRGVHVRILDEQGRPLAAEKVGEVCVSGKNVIKGYHNNPKATSESFYPDPSTGALSWFRTGDLGYMDPSGFLFLVGRIKEQINRGGEKISPVEIDQVLLEHPNVSEAVAFGVPSGKYGQEVEAVVVLKSGTFVSEENLKAFASKKLAGFKIPKRIHVSDALPKTATGKIQRRIVADAFCESKPKL